MLAKCRNLAEAFSNDGECMSRGLYGQVVRQLLRSGFFRLHFFVGSCQKARRVSEFANVTSPTQAAHTRTLHEFKPYTIPTVIICSCGYSRSHALNTPPHRRPRSIESPPWWKTPRWFSGSAQKCLRSHSVMESRGPLSFPRRLNESGSARKSALLLKQSFRSTRMIQWDAHTFRETESYRRRKHR